MRRITSKCLTVLLCMTAVMSAGIICGAAESTEQQDIIIADERSQSEFAFADVSNVEFWFSSGAGAWGTMLRIHGDGSFEGQYHDSDMGDTGDGYPGGTIYLCDFTGSFTETEKIDNYTYSFQLESLDMAREPEDEEIKEQVRYVYSIPYGMDNGEEFLLYLPGKPLQELPEEFRSWVGYYDLSGTSDTELPFYGVYNVQGGYGFSGFEIAEELQSWDLTEVEAEAELLENRLAEENLTQSELNELSAQLYQLWDDELNAVWSELKATLDEQAMNQLVESELEWISYKESEMQAAGEPYGDGSIREMVQYTKGAELTRERTYELAELLK